MPRHLYPGFTTDFEHGGRTFRLTLEYDHGSDTPWDREDGHGPVSDWTSRAKAPGEVVLTDDGRARAYGGSRRYYDFAGATRIAKRDGWGLEDDAKAKLAARLGRAPTAKEIAREAVAQDFDRLRRWCADDWCYVGAVVQELDEDGDPLPHVASLWGIESDCGDYILDEVAPELADECAGVSGDLLRA